MKHKVKIITVLLLSVIVSSCSNNGDMANRIINSNNVEKVMNEQIEQVETQNNTFGIEEAVNELQEDTEKGYEEDAEEKDYISEKSGSASDDVCYDLTIMNSEMVYAMVYQMMADPNTYLGKTFRIEGTYYAVYYEATAQYYHYCLIQDALACCAQGIEFIWGDGSHVYPKDYPDENAKIVVEGTFETYKEDGDDILYCRLKDATMEVIN